MTTENDTESNEPQEVQQARAKIWKLNALQKWSASEKQQYEHAKNIIKQYEEATRTASLMGEIFGGGSPPVNQGTVTLSLEMGATLAIGNLICKLGEALASLEGLPITDIYISYEPPKDSKQAEAGNPGLNVPKDWASFSNTIPCKEGMLGCRVEHVHTHPVRGRNGNQDQAD